MSITSPAIPALPNNLTNGTPNDASQVMADFNQIRNSINTNLASVAAQSGASYLGVTTDARWLGTSVQDALAQLITNTQVNDTGSVNAIAFTTTPNITALTNNLFVWVKAANTNTSSTVTLAAGTTAATGVVLNDGTGLPPPGSIIGGQIYGFWYSTGLSKWVLINPSSATGSFTITLSGMTVTTTGTVNYRRLPDGYTANVWLINAITGTSNAATMTGTGIPNTLVCLTSKTIRWATLEDNGAILSNAPFFSTGTGNTWTFGSSVGENTSNFTASGAKGWRPDFKTMDLS